MTLNSPLDAPTGAASMISSGGSRVVADRSHFEELLKVNLSREEMARLMGCSTDAVESFSRQYFGMDYDSARLAAMSRVKAMLVRRALALAMEGDSRMVQLCLRNLCGWDAEERRPAARSPSSRRKVGSLAEPGEGQGVLPGLLN
ncbi:MAG: hypothetical protein ACKOET_17470 [Verrucomicrobiota bacterium]